MPTVGPGQSEQSGDNAFAAAEAFASELGKGMKRLALYSHSDARHLEFLQTAFVAFHRFSKEFGHLTLRVSTDDVSAYGRPILGASDGADNVPYKFYSAGLRQIVLKSGLTQEELFAFTRIAMSNPLSDENVVAQLWTASLPHVEYTEADGYNVPGLSSDEAQARVEALSSLVERGLEETREAQSRFRSRLTDPNGIPAVSVPEVVEAAASMVFGARADTPLTRAIHEQLRADGEKQLFPKIMAAVLSVIDSGEGADVDALREVCALLLDAMLALNDFATVNALHARLAALERTSPQRASTAAALRADLRLRMADAHRIRSIGELLGSSPPPQPEEVARFLKSLPAESAPALLEALETIDLVQNRELVREALATIARETPQPFLKYLGSDRAEMVRDIVWILERCDFPSKFQYLATLFGNPAPAARVEALAALARTKSEQAMKLVTTATADPDPQVRLAAIGHLATANATKAVPTLLAMARSPDLEKRDRQEREAVIRALAATGDRAAVDFFAHLLSQKSLLRRGKAKDDRLLAIVGLEATASIPAYKMLQAATAEEGQDAEVRMAARKAMHAMKKTLFGEREPNPG